MRSRIVAFIFCGLTVLQSSVVKAHFVLSRPPSALASEDGGKGAPPCAEGTPSNIVTKVQGGTPLTIKLLEFVPHPGHYRVALSINSRAELPPDPDVGVDASGVSVSAAIQNPPRFPILADGLFPHTDASVVQTWQTDIVLPNINCARCTLQVIEFMAEHGPNVGGGYFYHHCADLQITAKPDAQYGRVVAFAATPTTIRAGQPATLSWTTAEATSVDIDGGVGAQPLSGSVTVTPTATTTYRLTATGARASANGLVTVHVLTDPQVVVGAFPAAMLQQAGSGGATASFTLTNAGGAPTTVTLSQSRTFFTQTPSSFTLNPGASQNVTITGTAQPSGAFEGASVVSGNGLQIPIKLLATTLPAGAANARPVINRVDVTAPAGTVSFTNRGDATLTGILTSDQPWLIPQSGTVTIAPGATSSVSFTIDRSKRSGADGSVSGNLSLAYLSGSSPWFSRVSIVDTVQLPLMTADPPPLAADEVALFVPGVGHVAGTVGTFISDVSLRPASNGAMEEVRLFYGAKSTSLPSIGGDGLALADVAKTMFGSEAQVGSLQIRSAGAASLPVDANIFNSSNPAGTTGTTIPIFRSDRGVGAGDRLVLTGLRHDATTHTNLFIQDVSGVGATVRTEFLAADGACLGARTDDVGPFALTAVNNVVPEEAVAAILTTIAPAVGKFAAYATPVDDASGDNWSVVDWSKQFGYSGSEAVIIPVAGVVRGANDTFFRTDMAVTNTGSGPAGGTLRFVSRGGDEMSRPIMLGARQSNIARDVVGTLFGRTSDDVGYLVFTPTSGSFAVTSRTYSTAGRRPGTFGTGVPTLAASSALRAGAMQSIGALEDAARATVLAARPATFRTNFGLLEVGGSSVRVRVTLRLPAIGSASKDYTLNPHQFLLLNGIAGEILGVSRDALGDLHGLEADFQVLDGNGAVVVFTSSVDNGTGDSILRTGL